MLMTPVSGQAIQVSARREGVANGRAAALKSYDYRANVICYHGFGSSQRRGFFLPREDFSQLTSSQLRGGAQGARLFAVQSAEIVVSTPA